MEESIMPLVDMSVEKLFQYQGSSPCPADIDTYWDEALAEMNAVEPNVEFVKKEYASKAADMYDLYFTGTKNARIHARVAVPKNISGKVPAVLLFHGLSGSAGEWCSLLQYVSQGFVAAFMDARGQGGESQDVGGVSGTTYTTPFTRGLDGDKHDLLMRDVYLDTALLAKIIMGLDYVDENRVGVWGFPAQGRFPGGEPVYRVRPEGGRLRPGPRFAAAEPVLLRGHGGEGPPAAQPGHSGPGAPGGVYGAGVWRQRLRFSLGGRLGGSGRAV
jgi:hypothetical protein